MSYAELARQLAEINKKMVKLPVYTQITDIGRGEGVLLSYLAHHDGKATPVELSEALDVSTARISALLNKMERKQCITRQKHLDNRKNVLILLLPAGAQQYKERSDQFSQNTIAFFEMLGEERAALFVELQDEMVRFLAKETDRGDQE